MAIRKQDLLEALGLQEQGVTAWMIPALIGLGVGALLGATTALLLAPKPGAELRDDLLQRGRRMVQRGKDEMENLGSNIGTSSRPST